MESEMETETTSLGQALENVLAQPDLSQVPFGAEPEESSLELSQTDDQPELTENTLTPESSTESESEQPLKTDQESQSQNFTQPKGQLNLFKESDETKRMWHLEKERGAHKDTIGANLKKASAFLKLLKGVPENIQDIYFRCNAAKLSGEMCELYAQQAAELAGHFLRCRDSIEETLKMDPEIYELRIKLGYVQDPNTGTWTDELHKPAKPKQEGPTPEELESEANKILKANPDETEENPNDPWAEQQAGGPL